MAKWTERREALKTVLASRDHHVWCFQEVATDQLRYLQGILPNCGFIGVGRDDGKEEGVRCPVFYDKSRFEAERDSTFWFRPDPDTPGMGWGEVVPRICTWVQLRDKASGTSFRVYNAHMQLNPFAQKKAALLLIERLRRSRLPVVLVGDLNSGPFSPTLRLLKSSGFRDANAERSPSFPIFGMGVLRPDHIITDSSWRAERFGVIREAVDGIFPSDHFGLESTLYLTGSQ